MNELMTGKDILLKFSAKKAAYVHPSAKFNPFISEELRLDFMSHLENGFFVISAFKGEQSWDKNWLIHRELENDLSFFKLKHFQLFCSYSDETGKETEEITDFVLYQDKYSEDDYFYIARELASEYEQKRFLFCVPSNFEVCLFEKENSSWTRRNLGSFDISEVNRYCSELKSKCIFEGHRSISGFMNAIALKTLGVIWLGKTSYDKHNK